jgi:hypothetical protein
MGTTSESTNVQPCDMCQGSGVCQCPWCDGKCKCDFDRTCFFCKGKGKRTPYTWNRNVFSFASREERNELVMRLRAFVAAHKLPMRVVAMRKQPIVKLVCRDIPRDDRPWDPVERKHVDVGHLYGAIWRRYDLIVGEFADRAAVRRFIFEDTSDKSGDA